jgi:ubiquinone/menaquinone biosynthesis C-methylase UbiE
MSEKTMSLVEIAYSNCAPIYEDDRIDQMWGHLGESQRSAEDFIGSVKDIQEVTTVVDIGCGTGAHAQKILDMVGPQAHMIGVEPALGMRQKMRQKFRDNERITVRKGTFENLPLRRGAADLVISNSAFSFCKNPQVAVKELDRVTPNRAYMNIFFLGKGCTQDVVWNIVRDITPNYLSPLQRARIMSCFTLFDQDDALRIFSPLSGKLRLELTHVNKTVYGTIEEHIHWYKARSPLVYESIDPRIRERFIAEVRSNLERIKTQKGIPLTIDAHIVRGRPR